jgi:hypothetical protein
MAPPTDSLYKFIAITGLALILWGTTFSWQKSFDFKIKLAELKSEIAYRSAKAESYERQYDILKEKIKNFSQLNNGEEDVDELRIQKRELYIKYIEYQQPIDKEVEVLSVINGAQMTFQVIGWVSVALGIFLSIIGFYLWYSKIQCHIDKKCLDEK